YRCKEDPTGEIIWSAVYNGSDPPNGDGIVFSVKYQAVDSLSETNPLTANIVVMDTDFSDPLAQPIDVKVNADATVIVEPCYKFDFNCDNIVDVFDIVLLINEFDKTCADSDFDARFDLNSDCIIDVFDIVLLINNFGWEGKTSKKDLNSSPKKVRSTRDMSVKNIPELGDMAVNEIICLDLFTNQPLDNLAVAY
ncbi:MAG: hypothetical protein OMM_15236, partial [Candidatus Magnetoglobus multicellularis str. Araruama]